MTPLRRRMLQDMKIRNLAHNTQLSYLQQVSSFAKYFQRSPELLGPEDIRAYQVHIGWAQTGLGCFTCITGQAAPDQDYEIEVNEDGTAN